MTRESGSGWPGNHDGGAPYLRAAGLGACEIDGERRFSGGELCWRILGWGSDEPDVTPLSRLFETMHPEDRDKVEAAVEEALARAARLEVVFRVPVPGGPARVIGLRGSSTTKDGHSRLLCVMADITDLRRQQDERRRSETRDIVVRELGHRLRNLFPVILAMVKLTAQTQSTVADYRISLERRLRALAAAERLLTRGASESASVEELVRTEIAPFDGGAQHEIQIEGPNLTLRGGMAQSFAMIVHELATNAVKHGALSVPDGKLRAVWRLETDEAGAQTLIFEWAESDGPAPRRSGRKGFGSLVLGESGTSLLGGRAESSFTEEGFRYVLRAPLEAEPASGPLSEDAVPLGFW
ncbi:hypothetical protein SLNSH_22535 [Alsobacter soli]|uniref:Blue-light-activated histidine kinase n=1 Tax=Alsobacter soli TaxID=2109933 RepID=A0A2T1HM21_9HYPH|nr:sensor histidine kinase [Alsobacter soli]PSC02705.1 hypothetical protein SLNSH_22535 [Alsobacter soli]